MQVSCGLESEMPRESASWPTSEISWRGPFDIFGSQDHPGGFSKSATGSKSCLCRESIVGMSPLSPFCHFAEHLLALLLGRLEHPCGSPPI